jgi:hypothetical protein
MGRLLKLSLVFVAIMAVSIGSKLVPAQATNLTAQQSQQIVDNCDSLKNTLGQLRLSDTLTRVNMGQQYELVSTRLMDRFNNRVSNNNLKVDILRSSSDVYKSYLDTFREDYIKYEESLAVVLRTDCKSQPGGFYNLLMTARYNRSKVYDDVNNMNKQIDKYRSDIGQFEKYFQALGAN